MKTFIVSLLLLTLTLAFVIWNAWDLNKTLDSMLDLTQALPKESATFRKNTENEKLLDTLWQLWDKNFNRLTVTTGYSNCNRADEAIVSMIAHYQNGNAEDFTHARLLLWDSLKRMKMLESVSLHSIL